jgi:hypothetical protein
MINSNRVILFIFLILPFHLFSQKRLIDQDNSSPIPYAHILLDNKYYTYSDENGAFVIDAKQKFDTLKITHLTYETRLISYNDIGHNDIIKLKEKATVLNEVTITSKRKTKKKQILLPERTTRDFIREKHDIRLLFETGITADEEENPDAILIAKAIYIPNKNKKDGALITKIILNSVDKEVEGDTKYIPFKVNLMTYDTISKLPKDNIYTEDLAVGKKKGQKVIIDLSKEELIEFPKEGICIVVSVYSTNTYNNNGFNPPRFDAVSLKKSSGFREYWSYRSAQWEENMYSKEREQCFNFGIEIEYFE